MSPVRKRVRLKMDESTLVHAATTLTVVERDQLKLIAERNGRKIAGQLRWLARENIARELVDAVEDL